MTNKRQAISEMLRQVEAGNAYTVESNGEPIAVVVPWEHWADLLKSFVAADTLQTAREVIARALGNDYTARGNTVAVLAALEDADIKLVQV